MTLFLSRLLLDGRSRLVQRDLADCQCLHRRVMEAFPSVPGPAREALGVLYRLEEREGGIALLVQAKCAPDWASLPAGYLATEWFDGAVVAVKPLDGLIGSLETGQTLRFRLRANPTRCIDSKSGSDGARRRGKRVPLRREDSRREWLKRKAGPAGFEILEVSPQVSQVVETGRERVRGGQLTLEGVVFDGRLRIVDVGAFRDVLGAGIGPGKAYGFGLLSVAPG